jgi:replicative DNA helicase
MNAILRDYDDREAFRPLPQSIEAEQSVLGGLMLAPDSLASISDWLAPDDFLRADHRLIYRAILELSDKGRPFDAVTLGEWFDAQGLIEQVAGGAYLIELASTTPSAANIVAYAEIVKDKAALREGIEIGSKLVNDCFRPEGRDTVEIVSGATRQLTQLSGDPKGGGLVQAASTLTDWFEDLQHRYDHGSNVTGLPYPWKDINDITHGLHPGELTIIAARPSMGKSIMGLNLALFSALRGVNTAFFSLEMTHRQINRRNIASLGNVPHDWLLAPNKDQDDLWTQVTAAIRQLRGASLLVDETAGLNTDQFVARARRAHRQKPIQLLVLDHLHDMDFPGKRDMRHEVGAAVAAGKKLGKEFGCPVVMLAQLNRAVEDRVNKRPIMKDLRESGEIEQKADVIWFLYREDYYAMKENESHVPVNDVEVILGKGRDLRATKPIILRNCYDTMRLADWEGDRPVRFTQSNSNTRGMR